MKRLRNFHQGGRALVIFGGPSLLEHRVDLSRLRETGDVLFLETKALTPEWLRRGVRPDYYLMLFPEKAKGHALHDFVFRALLAQRRIRPYLTREALAIAEHFLQCWDRYLTPWRPQRGAHKRYQWRPDAFLPGSPYELLSRIPDVPIIANGPLLRQHFPGFDRPNPIFEFEQSAENVAGSLDDYFMPLEKDGRVVICRNNFLNSAAIALYPLLRYMGFSEVRLLGMDMSMLGSMEYAALYTFRSLWHFRWYFARTRHVFNASFRPNRPFYIRPQTELEDARRLLNWPGMVWTRIYEPFRYTVPINGIRQGGYDALWSLKRASVEMADARRY